MTVPPIIESTTDIGLKTLPDREVGSPHAHAVRCGVREMGEDKEGKLGGVGDCGVGPAGKGVIPPYQRTWNQTPHPILTILCLIQMNPRKIRCQFLQKLRR